MAESMGNMEYSRSLAIHLTTKNGLQLAFDFIIINMKKNSKYRKYREKSSDW